ncbi:MAG: type secretion system major pseudopilin GspG [Verrucomicrobiota bacterium]|jgi:general secretion pathway protein G
MKPLFALRRNTTAAFTLLEIMLVVMIIALLAGSAIYLMRGNVDVAKEVRVKTDIQNILTQVQLYETLNGGRLPTNEEGLQALVKPKRGAPILKEGVPKDPWGTEYQYRNPATKSKQGFDVFSAGRDYKAGTDDDIGNWD